MSTHNIQFHDKLRKILKIFVFELSEEFLRDSKTSSNHPRSTRRLCSNHRDFTVLFYGRLKRYPESILICLLSLHYD